MIKIFQRRVCNKICDMRKAFSDIVPATEEILKVMGEQIKLAEVKR